MFMYATSHAIIRLPGKVFDHLVRDASEWSRLRRHSPGVNHTLISSLNGPLCVRKLGWGVGG